MAQVACGWKEKDEKNTHGSCLNWNKSSSIIGPFVGLTESLSHRRYIAVESSLISAPQAWGPWSAQRGAVLCGAAMIPAPVVSSSYCRSCWISAKAGTPVSCQSASRDLWICSGDDESRQFTLPSMSLNQPPPPFIFLFVICFYL